MELQNLIIAIVILVILVLTIVTFVKKPQKKIHTQPIQSNPSIGNTAIILQAYERLVTLTERMGFTSLIQRMQSDILNAPDLAAVYAETIRNEYEFNLSQQLYVSDSVWQAITDMKEQQLFILQQVLNTLPVNATGSTLNEALSLFLQMDENASLHQTVLQLIRFEAKKHIHHN